MSIFIKKRIGEQNERDKKMTRSLSFQTTKKTNGTPPSSTTSIRGAIDKMILTECLNGNKRAIMMSEDTMMKMIRLEMWGRNQGS